MKKELGMFVLLVLLCVITAVLNPQFLTGQNIQTMSRLIGMYGVFSIGVGIVIMTGGIDLSIGSLLALLGVVLSMMLTDRHWSPVLAVPAIIAIALLLGLGHGLLVTRVRIQPFIVTLCGLLFYRGVARTLAQDATKQFPSESSTALLERFASGTVAGVPMPFVILVIISLVMWVILDRSVYGRYLFAIGRNEEAARYSGINSRKIITSAYMISTGLTGVAAILLAFYTKSVSPSTHGNFYELYAIAAAVLGGCSLRGGEGSIIGILIGTALLQVLRNLVSLLGIPTSLEFAVMGAVILIGVIADEILKRRSKTTMQSKAIAKSV